MNVAIFACALCAAVAARDAHAQFSCATATPVPLSTPFNGNSSTSPGDGLAGLCANTGHAVWHSFTAGATGTHTIALCGSSFNTVLTLYAEPCGSQVLACDNDTCGNNAIIVFPLVAGTAYRLRVASEGASAGGAYVLRITEPSQTLPPNDSCGGAAPLTPNLNLRGSNIGAIGSDITTTCGQSDTSDVWYSFIPATTGMHRAEVCATGFAPVLSLHSGCLGGVLQQCDAGAGLSGCNPGESAAINFSATAGQPALIRVAGARGSVGTFNLVLYSARPNDTCANAVTLAIGTSTAGQTTPILASEVVVPCAPSGADVWYRIIPASTGTYAISVCGATFNTVLSLHSACPNQPGSALIACNDDLCGTASAFNAQLTAGVAYFVRVAGKLGTDGVPAWGSFSVLVTQQAPSNDLCTNALPLTEGVPVNADNIGATGTDMTSCGASDTKDVWFSFTANNTAMYEFNTCSSRLDISLAVFASCGGAQLSCSENDLAFCGSNFGSRLTVAMTQGVNYRVRVAGLGGGEGSFVLAVARTAPPNDNCSTASPIALGVQLAATVTGATPSGVTACGLGNGADVWFALVPPASRYYRIETCGSTLVGVVSVYPGCNTGIELACATDALGACSNGNSGGALVVYLEQGVAYRIRVGANPAIPTGGAFRLLVTPTTPPNDDCTTATALGLNQTTYGATTGAMTSPAIAPCAGGGGAGGAGDTMDVWYSFVPPATGTYRFNTCAASTLDTVLTVHTACNAPAIACNDDDSFCGAAGPSAIRMRLTAGTQYLVRVAGKANASGPFYITATIAPPANDECASAQVVGEGLFVFDTLAATTDPIFIDSSCPLGFNLISNDVWFAYTPSRSAPIVVSTCGASFDTAMTIAAASGACPSGNASVLACNDDFPCLSGVGTPTPQSQLTFQAVGGQRYLIRVGSRLGTTGSGTLRITGPGCRCDWNGDNVLGVNDLFFFLQEWFALRGDFNGDGATGVQDIFDFLDCWFTRPSGC